MENLITYEKKTTFGVIGIILAFICWVCKLHFYLGFIPILILILFNLPSILLIMPDPKIKNNKILAIITTILLLLLIFLLWIWIWIWGDIFSIILIFYNFFCAESTVKEDEKDEHKCKNCGTEINEKHIFCPECGEKIKE